MTAVDRSPAMLAAARQEAERHGVSNVEFQTPAELFAGGRTFDFITCYFVLQRLPARRGAAAHGRAARASDAQGRRGLSRAVQEHGVGLGEGDALGSALGARRERAREHGAPAAVRRALRAHAHLRPGARVRGDSGGRHRDHARGVRAARGARDGAAVHGEAGRATRCRDLAPTSGGPIDVAELVEHTRSRSSIRPRRSTSPRSRNGIISSPSRSARRTRRRRCSSTWRC